MVSLMVQEIHNKKYDYDYFNDDISCLGYPIEIFQDSINKSTIEYLVNFDFFIRIMENYGFTIITDEEASSMGFPSGTGLFSELFQNMMSEIDQNSKKKNWLASRRMWWKLKP